MKIVLLAFASLALLVSCKHSPSKEVIIDESGNIKLANNFLDAFYSFDRDSLESSIKFAKTSQPSILYYQKWAECGNYNVVKRNDCIVKNDSVVVCPVTVKDNLMAALRIDFNVTDSFHITIAGGKIKAVETSSNDIDLYYEAKAWVKQNRTEFIEKPCEGIWEGGPTPCDCILGMIKGFDEFIAERKVK